MTDTGAGTPLTAITNLVADFGEGDDQWRDPMTADYGVEIVVSRRLVWALQDAAARPATDPAGLREALTTALTTSLAKRNVRFYGPVPDDGTDIDGIVADVLARLSVADGPGPEERP